MTWIARVLSLGMIWVIASPGWAETRVRAGEHANFTRLVLYFPSRVDEWTSARVDDGYTIDIVPAPRSLDITDVFAFIPRTRVRDLVLRDGKVWLNSDCDCHISVFRARPDVIAIDIRDGPDPSQPAMAPDSAVGETSEISPFFLALRTQEIGKNWFVSPYVAFVPPWKKSQVPDVIKSTELANAVARAASGGVLRPNNTKTALEGPGIETRSALDSANRDHDARVQTELCSNLALLDDVAAISSADAWQLIENTTSEKATIQLAMAYMSLGFGAEAAVNFINSSLPAENTIMLAQTARFLDAPDGPAPRGLHSALSCGGMPALLALMATPPSQTVLEKHALEAVNTLSRLPYALRAHLAPYVERRLVIADFSDLAQSASFTSLRASRDNGAEDRAKSSTTTSANPQGAYRPKSLPQTAFFDAATSMPIYETISAARFAAEDRILVEAWIKEATDPVEADTASTFYVDALNMAGRPLDALAHLDMRFGRRGIISPGLEDAIGGTLDTAAKVLGPAELLVLSARIAERPWYDRLPFPMRFRFTAAVDAARVGIMGESALPALETAPQDEGANAVTDLALPSAPASSSGTEELTVLTPRRIAAEAAIFAATESLSRSARLRAETTESRIELERQ